MEEAQEVQLLRTIFEGATDTIPDVANGNLNSQTSTIIKMKKKYLYWLRIALYVIFLLVGQSSGILLGRLYYQQGGKSKWLGALVQLVGFPILLPLYTISASKHYTSAKKTIHHNDDKKPSALKLAFVYVSLGFLLALDTFLSATGLSNLPASTHSLIFSSQLAFTAFFSFFINSQRFTPYIINSIVLLTISSILLVFQTGSSTAESVSQVSEKKYGIAFICTVAASAMNGLILSLTQFAFSRVVKNISLKGILDMIVYSGFVASLLTVMGLFGSGEFRGLTAEMEEYEMGMASYVLTLTFIAITWQVCTLGSFCLIMEVSSLFSNSITVVSLPVVPILAVFLFHDTVNGVKVISLVLALWGFMSYVYQHYLDETNKSKTQHTSHQSDV